MQSNTAAVENQAINFSNLSAGKKDQQARYVQDHKWPCRMCANSKLFT